MNVIYIVGVTTIRAMRWKDYVAPREWSAGQPFCILTADRVRGLEIHPGDRIVYVGPVYDRKDFEELEWGLRFATGDAAFTRRIEYVNELQ